ncbi:hypothetical protein C5167_038278 [Papaver somniferum]|uniref:Fumarylacetoacetase n=1 Tax=Papaver somniferum TaxID=3469 RepID=A0A4Y7IC67_PAPSO|nr:hypothetical protein C5167_038278 [Papaver somniferum]
MLVSWLSIFAENSLALNKFLAMGRPAWKEARSTIQKLLSADEPTLRENASLREKAILPMGRSSNKYYGSGTTTAVRSTRLITKMEVRA